MPAKSAKQKKLMDAAAHNSDFAKKVGIPSKVAKKFSSTSKGMKFKNGSSVNRIGRAVAPSRRDPDIGKMIKEVKVEKDSSIMEYACGGEVVVRGTGAARTQKARIC